MGHEARCVSGRPGLLLPLSLQVSLITSLSLSLLLHVSVCMSLSLGLPVFVCACLSAILSVCIIVCICVCSVGLTQYSSPNSVIRLILRCSELQICRVAVVPSFVSCGEVAVLAEIRSCVSWGV